MTSIRRTSAGIGTVTVSAVSSTDAAWVANRRVASTTPASSEWLGDDDFDPVAADAGLELGRRAVGDVAPVVEHDDVVGEPVGLVEVLRREQDGRAVTDQVAQHVPQIAAAPRIETGGRLVEEQHGRVGHQAGGEIELAAHAAGEVLRQPIGGVFEVEPLEELVGLASGDTLGQAVEPADHHEVAAGGQQPVDGRLLGGDADAAANGVRIVATTS